MMGFGGGGSVAAMWLMGLFGLLMVAGVIVLVVWAIRALLPPRPAAAPSTDPLAHLQLRLARGEITPDEYEELRAHMRE